MAVKGHILIDPQPSGANLFNDTPNVIASLRVLRKRTLNQLGLRAHQHTQKGNHHG